MCTEAKNNLLGIWENSFQFEWKQYVLFWRIDLEFKIFQVRFKDPEAWKICFKATFMP